MTEWWSYTLSDFLLFSSRTYYRLLERHNEAVWPAQVLVLALGLTILGLLLRPAAWQGRGISGILAVLWAWVAWAFFWRRYSTINWAAPYLVPVFAIEILLLGWMGVIRGALSFRPSRTPAGLLGLALFILSLFLYPMIAPMAGRPWRQAESFGSMPDPTVIATLGLLLLIPGARVHWTLLVVPLLWCGITGATLWLLHSPEAWLPPLAGLLVVAASIWMRESLRQPSTSGQQVA